MECYNLQVIQQFLLRAPALPPAPVQYVGEWLSLVEHLVRDQGVGGSNPLSPTNSFKQLERFQHPQFWVQWVQLAISMPQWACGNRVPPVPP